MARVLRLADLTQATTQDLLAGDLRLRDAGWSPRMASGTREFKSSSFGGISTFKQYEPVVETMELVGRDPAADLRAAVVAIEKLRERCRLWHNDPLQPSSIWLECNSDGETAKRSLLYDIELGFPANPAASILLRSPALYATLTLTRHPLWEDISVASYSSTSVSGLGGSFIPTVTLGAIGRAPGRIVSTTVSGVNGKGTLTKIWLGIRESGNGFGTTHCLTRWECEDYTVLDAVDSAITGESGASPSGTTNNKVTVTYVTKTLAKRWQQTVDEALYDEYGGTPTYSDMIGSYLVLLRCKVNSGHTSGVQLRYGCNAAGVDTFERCTEKYISNTSWELIELGKIQIPVGGLRRDPVTWTATNGADVDARYTELQIWSEEITAGTGTSALELDCLILIPAGHMVSGTGSSIEYNTDSALDPSSANIVVTENDSVVGACNNLIGSPLRSGPRRPLIDFASQDWYWPILGGQVVFAAQGTASALTDAANISLNVYPRWHVYRSA